VINNEDDSALDFAATDSSEWEAFRAWRDGAIARLKSDGEAGE
jgi:hypothetical protein